MYRAHLRWQPIAVLVVLALVWGANMAIIKIGARELAPCSWPVFGRLWQVDAFTFG